MRNYLNIGSTPYDEPCAPVGSDNYHKLSIIECRVFLGQCKRVLEQKFPSYTVNLAVKSFPHDFGTYKEVVVYYDDDNPQESEQAWFLDSADLATWDEEALKELAELGYKLCPTS